MVLAQPVCISQERKTASLERKLYNVVMGPNF